MANPQDLLCNVVSQIFTVCSRQSTRIKILWLLNLAKRRYGGLAPLGAHLQHIPIEMNGLAPLLGLYSRWRHDMEALSRVLVLSDGNPLPLTKGRWYGDLMFSLLLAWTSCWIGVAVIWDIRTLTWHCCNSFLDSFDLFTHILQERCSYCPSTSEVMLRLRHRCHSSDVMISAMAPQITGVWIVCSTVFSGIDQRKHQSSASLAFLRRIHRWPMDSPHKGPVMQKSIHLMTSSCEIDRYQTSTILGM